MNHKEEAIKRVKPKKKSKGCACYGVNTIHPCFCTVHHVNVKSKKRN